MLRVDSGATPDAPPATGAASRRRQAGATAAARAKEKLRPAQIGAHGHSIQLLAITDDGTAAVTADFNRMIRVWPALDGTREPVIVTGPVPLAVAIAHDGDGFAIAIQDAGGTLHVERIAHDGAQRVEVPIESPLPFEQIEATRTGFVALRADDTVEIIAPDGSHHSIAPPPARIARLVVRGDGVLALGEGRGRLLVDGKWGEASTPLTIDPLHAVLAPDQRHVAGIGAHNAIVEVDLASGRIAPAGDAPEIPLGYSDATTLVTMQPGTITWRGLAHRTSTDLSSVVAFTEATTVIGDGRVIAALGVQLVFPVPAPEKTTYLGYDLVDPAPFHATPFGLVVRSDLPHVVDEQLVARALLAKPHEGDWMDFTMLDDRIGVALVRDFTEDMEKRWCEVIDLATGKRIQKLAADARLDTLVWEPSTKLFATLSLLGGQLYRYEGGKLVEAGSIPGSPDRVFLLDPALAGGDVAILVESGQMTRLDGKQKTHDPKPLHDSLLLFDRSGRMIARRGTDLVLGEIVVKDLGRDALRVSPDLKRIVAFDSRRIALVDRDGSIRWSVVAWGTRDIGWTPDNELIASGGGLVRLDLATGQPVSRRCGWTFALTTTVHSGAPTGTSACDD